MSNAIEFLTKQHDKVKKLLNELTSTQGEKTRKQLLEEIATELEVHIAIEEEIFYPAFRDAAKSKEQQRKYYEAIEEHRAVEEMVLPDLMETDPGSVEFGGRAKVLKELVLHHVGEEETDLFPLMEKLVGSEELDELGARLEERSEELMREAAA